MEGRGDGHPPEASVGWRVGSGGGVYRSKGYRARELRQTATPAESKVWEMLRGKRLGGIKFRRQHQIGPYIVDFCSLAAKVVIELNGSAHDSEEARAYDQERRKFLEGIGFQVLEYDNEAVLGDPRQFEAQLLSTIVSPTPHADAPSPQGEGAKQTRPASVLRERSNSANPHFQNEKPNYSQSNSPTPAPEP